ncbi:MAG: hypothetical protein ACTHOF_12730 [Flavisolibacter sp.]
MIYNMVAYKNIHSGVSAYELGPNYIVTKFGKQYYLYSNKITGAKKINRMKELAIIGEGLSSFISRNIRKSYEAMFETEKELRDYLKHR